MCFRLESIEGNEGQRIRRVSTTDESSEEEEELTEEEQGLCIVCFAGLSGLNQYYLAK